MKEVKKCFECGNIAEFKHHVIPRSKGGNKTIALCNGCHNKVHDVIKTSASALTKLGKMRKYPEIYAKIFWDVLYYEKEYDVIYDEIDLWSLKPNKYAKKSMIKKHLKNMLLIDSNDLMTIINPILGLGTNGLYTFEAVLGDWECFKNALYLEDLDL